MRPIEILIAVSVVVAGLNLLFGGSRLLLRWVVAASVLLCIAHAIFEGAHWQLIPIYLAVIVLCVAAWKASSRRRRLTGLVGGLCLLLAAAGVLFSFVLPMFHLPKPTGPYAVGTTILYWTDSSRIEDAIPGGHSPREFAVQFWYPAEPSHNPFAPYRRWRETRPITSYQSEIATDSRWNAPLGASGAPFPIVLFNPGWHGRRSQNTALTEELASHGYFVAAIDHTYNAGVVAFPDGRVIVGNPPPDVAYPDGSNPQKVREVFNKELAKWVADEEFVLNRLEEMNRTPGAPWYGRLDTHREAAVGHSFGGAASTLLCAEDPRIHAAVNLDGWLFHAIQARGANQPLLVMNSQPTDTTLGPDADVGAILNAKDFLDLNESLRKFGGLRVYVRGAEHEDFTDQAMVSPLSQVAQRGTVPALKMQEIVRAYVLAYLDKYLRGQDPPILHPHAQPFPEAVLEYWPSGQGDAQALAAAKAGSAQVH